MDEQNVKGRVNFMLRLHPNLASEIKELASERGVSANFCATVLLRAGLTASQTNQSINDRLSMMGIR